MSPVWFDVNQAFFKTPAGSPLRRGFFMRDLMPRVFIEGVGALCKREQVNRRIRGCDPLLQIFLQPQPAIKHLL